MIHRLKFILLIAGIVLGITGVYMFVLMDFTVIQATQGITDGLGFALISGEQTTGFTRFIYMVSSSLPFTGEGTHALTLTYFIVRSLDIFILILAVSFITYGILGPRNENELRATLQGMDEDDHE